MSPTWTQQDNKALLLKFIEWLTETDITMKIGQFEEILPASMLVDKFLSGK